MPRANTIDLTDLKPLYAKNPDYKPPPIKYVARDFNMGVLNMLHECKKQNKKSEYCIICNAKKIELNYSLIVNLHYKLHDYESDLVFIEKENINPKWFIRTFDKDCEEHHMATICQAINTNKILLQLGNDAEYVSRCIHIRYRQYLIEQAKLILKKTRKTDRIRSIRNIIKQAEDNVGHLINEFEELYTQLWFHNKTVEERAANQKAYMVIYTKLATEECNLIEHGSKKSFTYEPRGTHHYRTVTRPMNFEFEKYGEKFVLDALQDMRYRYVKINKHHSMYMTQALFNGPAAAMGDPCTLAPNVLPTAFDINEWMYNLTYSLAWIMIKSTDNHCLFCGHPKYAKYAKNASLNHPWCNIYDNMSTTTMADCIDYHLYKMQTFVNFLMWDYNLRHTTPEKCLVYSYAHFKYFMNRSVDHEFVDNLIILRPDFEKEE